MEKTSSAELQISKGLSGTTIAVRLLAVLDGRVKSADHYTACMAGHGPTRKR